MVLDFLTAEMNGLGGEDVTATGKNLNLALTAAALAAAGRRQMHAVLAQCGQQRFARLGMQQLGAVVDVYGYLARIHKPMLAH